jgi:hypothetical protein
MKSLLVVQEVRSKKEQRAFAAFPWKIYRNDPLWVPPLFSDRLKTFNIKKHKFYENGEAEFYVAYRDGEMVGKICVAEDRFHNKMAGLNEAIFGFFDCVDDEQVAELLFNTALSRAAARGLDRILGPFNLDYEDSYGVLLEGRDRPAALFCGHSPEYYRGFFENFGFKPARENNIDLLAPIDSQIAEFSRVGRLADRIRDRGRFTIREGNKKNWDGEVRTIHYFLNECLKVLSDFFPVSLENVQELVDGFKLLADPKLILFI